MEIDERTRKSVQKYRVILNHYGCTNIAQDLSDEAIYDLMYTINWMGGQDYSRYYEEYRSAEKDEEKLVQIKERYVNRTKKLLQNSGFDDKQIEEKLSQGYAEKIRGLHCWAGGLQCIFRDYFGPKEIIEDYTREFEEDTNKREESISKKISTKKIGQATINVPTTTKKEAEQVENGENTRDNIKEGEEVGDDN